MNICKLQMQNFYNIVTRDQCFKTYKIAHLTKVKILTLVYSLRYSQKFVLKCYTTVVSSFKLQNV